MSENGRQRIRLPPERDSCTKKFSVGGHKGYLTVGVYPDGRPGEIFIRLAKEGSTMAGTMDALAIAVSIGLQSGVPLATFCRKYVGTRFEPAGVVLYDEHQEIATSIPDYIFRWLARRYCPEVLGEPQIVEALHDIKS
jgi:ribonucleoside-diphosphate reductase alpha chain